MPDDWSIFILLGGLWGMMAVGAFLLWLSERFSPQEPVEHPRSRRAGSVPIQPGRAGGRLGYGPIDLLTRGTMAVFFPFGQPRSGRHGRRRRR